MIGNSLLTQVIVAGIAIAIILTYIQPTIDEITNRQNEIAQTRSELEKVNLVNKKLDDLVVRNNAISQRDRQALNIYLPDKIDTVRVLKDISTMSGVAGIILSALSYTGQSNPQTGEDEEAPSEHGFSVNGEGSYEQIKRLLALMEQNNYPLTIESLNITPTEGGTLTLSLELITYSHQ